MSSDWPRGWRRRSSWSILCGSRSSPGSPARAIFPAHCFPILAVLAYERSRPTGLPTRRGYFLAALFCYVAALLCHATAIGLPLVLIILDFYPLRRFELGAGGWLAVLEKWPFLLTAAGFSVLGYLAKGSSVKTLEHHDLWHA